MSGGTLPQDGRSPFSFQTKWALTQHLRTRKCAMSNRGTRSILKSQKENLFCCVSNILSFQDSRHPRTSLFSTLLFFKVLVSVLVCLSTAFQLISVHRGFFSAHEEKHKRTNTFLFLIRSRNRSLIAAEFSSISFHKGCPRYLSLVTK